MRRKNVRKQLSGVMLAGILAIQSCMGMNIQASEETEQDPFQMIADVSEDLLLTEDPVQAENPVSADNSVPDPEGELPPGREIGDASGGSEGLFQETGDSSGQPEGADGLPAVIPDAVGMETETETEAEAVTKTDTETEAEAVTKTETEAVTETAKTVTETVSAPESGSASGDASGRTESAVPPVNGKDTVIESADGTDTAAGATDGADTAAGTADGADTAAETDTAGRMADAVNHSPLQSAETEMADETMTESGMEEDPAETLRTEDESPVVPETEEESGAVLSAAYDSVEEETLLSAASDPEFTIENNILKKYSGQGGTVTIPDGVTSIANGVFSNNKTIANIILPASLTQIGNNCFSGCIYLRSVTWKSTKPKKVSTFSIGNNAFSGCTLLETVDVPDEIKSDGFGTGAFSGCSSLVNITIPSNIEILPNSVFNNCKSLPLDKNKKNGYIVFPSTLKTIGSSAFANCINLENISIPASVESFGDGCFANSSVVNVLINDNSDKNVVSTVIPDRMFTGCSKLTSVQFVSGKKIQSIGASAFSGCTNLTKIISNGETAGDGAFIIPAAVQTIGSSAFSGCTSLKIVYMSAKVNTIAESAFNGCTNLSKVERIQNSKVEIIGGSAFSGCKNLIDFKIPATVSSIGAKAFADTSLKSIEIPQKVVTVYDGTFRNCTSLSDVKIKGRVTAISENAFSGCSSLKSFTITYPNSIESIQSAAFSDCSSLVSFSIPDNITVINKDTFKNCSSLSVIAIPKGVITIDANAFSGCSGLTAITWKNGGSVKNIKASAFSGCKSLGTVELPSSTENIDDSAFKNSSVTIKAKCGSYVGNWAIRNDIQRMITDHKSVVQDAAVPVTCTTDGRTAGSHCGSCGDTISGLEVIPAGHDLTEHQAVAATCTQAGNRAYWHCSRCGKYFKDAKGKSEYPGSDWYIAPKGHNLTAHAAVAATEKKAGNSAYWSCSTCKKYFSDANAVNEIAKDSWVVPATGSQTSQSEVISDTTDTDDGNITTTVSISSAVITGLKSVVYTGSAIRPKVKVTLNGTVLKSGTDYTCQYSNNKNAGKAKVTVVGTGSYDGTVSAAFTIKKASQALKVKAKKPSVSKSSVKKKNQVIKADKTIKVSGAKGKITCKKVSGSKNLTVSGAGNITVRKGTKKGTYRITFRVTAAGNKNYKKKVQNVTVKVTVK